MITYINGTEQEIICIDGKQYYKDLYCICGCGSRMPFKKYHLKMDTISLYYSEFHLLNHKARRENISLWDLENGKSNEILIKSEALKLEKINNVLYYENKKCQCGCDKKIPYLKNHRGIGVPEYLSGHSPKEIKNSVELVEENGVLYYKDLFCECGCGEKIKYNKQHIHSGFPRYIKSHASRTKEFKNKMISSMHNRECIEKGMKTKKEKKIKKLEAENKNDYIVIKGIKHKTIIVNEIKYYRDVLCACGCGERIPARKSHNARGVPKFIQDHSSLGVNGIIVIDGTKCYTDLICACGCGRNIPIAQGKGKKYIDGHMHTEKKFSNTTEELVEVEGIRYYANIYCKCGCGQRIKYNKQHKYSGISKYIGLHYLNDEEYMENLRITGRERALKQSSQKSSYGMTGEFYSDKKKFICHTSLLMN